MLCHSDECNDEESQTLAHMMWQVRFPLTRTSRLASLDGFAGGSQAKERSIALQGNAVTQVRGCASRNPCSTMRHETPAAPPAAPTLGMTAKKARQHLSSPPFRPQHCLYLSKFHRFHQMMVESCFARERAILFLAPSGYSDQHGTGS
jgi:hypothetical protein